MPEDASNELQKRRDKVIERIQKITGDSSSWLDISSRTVEQLEAIERVLTAGVRYKTAIGLRPPLNVGASKAMQDYSGLIAAGLASRKHGNGWEFYRPEKDEGKMMRPNDTSDEPCADCGGVVGQDNGPPDGWQLEDGRTVCHACCVTDFKAFARAATSVANRPKEPRTEGT